MAWETLVPDSRTACGVPFGYAVRAQSQHADGKSRMMLAFVISARVVRDAKLADGAFLRVDVERKAGKGRLTVLAQQGKAGRRLHVSVSGRAKVAWPNCGAMAEIFGSVPCGTTPLACEVTSEGIVFDLPSHNQEGGKV